ncbi:hypothetical protein P3W45_001284 [Vairimorpha bombi]
MNNLLLKIHHIICNMDKYAKCFTKESNIQDFYGNKKFTGKFFDKSLFKCADTSYEYKLLTLDNLHAQPYPNMLYKIFWTEFDNVVNNYKDFRSKDLSTNSYIPTPNSVDEAFYMINKKKIIRDKKEIIKETKILDKAYLQNFTEKDLQHIKRLMCYMKYRISFKTESHIEYFIGLLRYLSIDLNLNIVIFLSRGQFSWVHCQILSIDGTNIQNLLFYYKKLLDKTKFIEPIIQDNIKNGYLHSFTTLLDQDTYSFDYKDGKDIGKRECLVFSCNHCIGYKSLVEWFDNFMVRCPYCRSEAVPIVYFKRRLYLMDD